MPFIGKCVKKDIDKLLLTDITDDRVIDFLENLEKSRSCSIKTRNLRLAALCSLAKYVSANSPEHIEWSRSIRNIPVKKAARTLITYLEKEEMNALLDAPDRNTSQGWRDYVLLLFLYNTGARAEEAATLLIRDLSLPRRKGLAVVSITGKGNKTRRCPLWQHTHDALVSVIKNRAEDERVFLNRLGQPITRFGIYEMVTRYAEKIGDRMPTIKQKRISPHTIRHTTATHLLQSGVDINTIRAWLGHVSINTTNIYAEVNMEMKAKALSNCEIDKKHKVKKHWKDDKKLMDFLDSL
jgi:site-specific recombinase XerD